MEPLVRQRCYHHPERETVARCPSCERFFCRECVTEHDDRMLCNECLAKLVVEGKKERSRWLSPVIVALQGVFGFLLVWYAFYLIGAMLLAIPHAFHEGTIWQADWWLNP